MSIIYLSFVEAFVRIVYICLNFGVFVENLILVEIISSLAQNVMASNFLVGFLIPLANLLLKRYFKKV